MSAETAEALGYGLASLMIILGCVLSLVAIFGGGAMALWAWRVLKEEWRKR